MSTAISIRSLPVQECLPIRMLDFMYFADQVCEFHQRWVGTAPGHDDVHVRRPLANGVENIIQVEKLVRDGIGNLIQDDELEIAGQQLLFGDLPGALCRCLVFFEIVALPLTPHSPGDHFKLLWRQFGGHAYLARLPFPLDELHHTYPPAMSHGTEGGARAAVVLPLPFPVWRIPDSCARVEASHPCFTPLPSRFCRAAPSAQGRDRVGDVTSKILFFTLLTLTPIHFPAPSLGGSGADRMDRRGASACPGAVMTARQ